MVVQALDDHRVPDHDGPVVVGDRLGRVRDRAPAVGVGVVRRAVGHELLRRRPLGRGVGRHAACRRRRPAPRCRSSRPAGWSGATAASARPRSRCPAAPGLPGRRPRSIRPAGSASSRTSEEPHLAATRARQARVPRRASRSASSLNVSSCLRIITRSPQASAFARARLSGPPSGTARRHTIRDAGPAVGLRGVRDRRPARTPAGPRRHHAGPRVAGLETGHGEHHHGLADVQVVGTGRELARAPAAEVVEPVVGVGRDGDLAQPAVDRRGRGVDTDRPGRQQHGSVEQGVRRIGAGGLLGRRAPDHR